MALWNFGILNLPARYLEHCLSYGLETWSTARDYLIKFWTNSVNFFPELWPFEKFDLLNLSARDLETIWAKSLKLGQLIGDDE